MFFPSFLGLVMGVIKARKSYMLKAVQRG